MSSRPTAALAAFGIVIAGALAYAGALRADFIFDSRQILTDPRLEHLWPPWGILTQSGRPITDLTFAANRAVGGTNPRGYVAVNVAIHLAAALVLFGLVRRSLAMACGAGVPPARDVQARRLHHKSARPATVASAPAAPPIQNLKSKIQNPTALAFAVALLWVVHPLTTQSVTYIIQRAESLMALFYLLTLYCVARVAQCPFPPAGGARGQAPRLAWTVAAITACALGMGSKLIMITAPVVALLYDRAILAGSFAAVWRRRRWLHLGLAAAWIIPLAQGTAQAVLSTTPRTGETVGFAFTEITPEHYALAQSGVVRYYLKLALWPSSLCLDYDWPIPRSWTAVFPDLVIISLLLLATLWALWKRPAVGFLAAAFFIVLAPTSSFVPLKDPIFEHRMYLPLAAVVTLVVLFLSWLIGFLERGGSKSVAVPLTTGLAVALAVPLGYATHRRHLAYRSDETMWRDVIAKRPASGRGHFNLAHNLFTGGRLDEAIDEMREAVRIDPSMIDWQYALGVALNQAGRPGEAVGPLSRALALRPNHGPAHASLAFALGQIGRIDESIPHYEAAIRQGAGSADLHYNLANAFTAKGLDSRAQAHFEEAIRLNPGFTQAHINLGNVFSRGGRPEDATRQFRAAINAESQRQRPEFLAQAHYNLGNALSGLDRVEEVIEAYRAAGAADPRHHACHYAMGLVLARVGRYEEAAAAYAECLRINPSYVEAQEALDAVQGRP